MYSNSLHIRHLVKVSYAYFKCIAVRKLNVGKQSSNFILPDVDREAFNIGHVEHIGHAVRMSVSRYRG